MGGLVKGGINLGFRYAAVDAAVAETLGAKVMSAAKTGMPEDKFGDLVSFFSSAMGALKAGWTNEKRSSASDFLSDLTAQGVGGNEMKNVGGK